MPITNPILIVCCNADDCIYCTEFGLSFQDCISLLYYGHSLLVSSYLIKPNLPPPSLFVSCHYPCLSYYAYIHAYIHSVLLFYYLWGFCFLIFISIFRKRKGKLKGQKFVFKTTSNYC